MQGNEHREHDYSCGNHLLCPCLHLCHGHSCAFNLGLVQGKTDNGVFVKVLKSYQIYSPDEERRRQEKREGGTRREREREEEEEREGGGGGERENLLLFYSGLSCRAPALVAAEALCINVVLPCLPSAKVMFILHFYL